MQQSMWESETLAGAAYYRLREEILQGRLTPGMKLSMRLLTERFKAGQTPMREALNRLTAEGLVENRLQRGFFVSDVNEVELLELTRTRIWVETLALRESMGNATLEWEENLLVARHRLSRTPRSLEEETFSNNPEWELLHRQLHQKLLERCGSKPLIDFCKQLSDRLYRYRMLSLGTAYPKRKVSDEHHKIVEAVLARDVKAATQLLAAHYQKTADLVTAEITVDRRDR